MTFKKGDIFQIFYVMVILLVAVLIGLMCVKMTVTFGDFMSSSHLLDDTVIGQQANDAIKGHAPFALDELMFFLFLGMNIALIIAAARTNFSPTIIFIFILLTLIAILAASNMVNIVQGVMQDESMADLSAKLPITNIIFSRFTPLIMCIMSGIILAVMYGKSGNEISP